MSYEYIRGLGAEDDDVFTLGVKAVAPGGEKQQGRQGRRQRPQQPRLTDQEKRQRMQEACGGIACPEGLRKKVGFTTDNPVRLAEYEEGMLGRGCSLLCTVGSQHTYCCPSTMELQEVVTDPFATDPMVLDVVETSIETTPTAPPVTSAPNGDGGSRLGLVAILGMLGLGTAGVIGYLALRKKRKKKSKKGKRTS